MEQELLLWRWSTAVQASSLFIIALFFLALSRSVRLAEVRWWAAAWTINLGALVVTLAFWYFQPRGSLYALLTGAYAAGKTAFVLLLIQGAWVLKRPGQRRLGMRSGLLGLVTYGVTMGLWATTVDRLGFTQHLVMALLLMGGAGLLLLKAPRHPGLGWLVAGCLVRATLALAEAAAYGARLHAAPDDAIGAGFAAFLAASSSFDSGVEWLLALGCVIALSERVQRELRQANQGLLAAQEDLRRLADRDPLTALANRRQLPEALRAVQPKGALLLFFDLDDFKQINDRYGHQVGDECLRRFASVLLECFRPDDVLVRYAGDEFLVVAAGLDEASARERTERLRERLRASAGGPEVSFSVGTAVLTPGGHPEEALKAADESMYAAKAEDGPAAAAAAIAGRLSPGLARLDEASRLDW